MQKPKFPTAADIPADGYFIVPPETANFWLANCKYRNQRNIRPYHVASLAREMEKGRFRQKTQINFVRWEGRDYLTNGQHTLSAISLIGIPWLLSVVILEVNSEDEIANDFARHDTHLTRTMGDSLAAHEMHIRYGITRTEMSWVASGALYYAYMLGECPRAVFELSHDEKTNTVESHGQLAVDALATLTRVNSNHARYLTRRTSLAAMMIIYRYSPELCRDFFGEISKDDGLKQGDPRKCLLDFFMRCGAGGAGGRSTFKQLKADHELIKSIAVCWNAFVSRRSLSVIRIKFETKEVVFDKCGTFKV